MPHAWVEGRYVYYERPSRATGSGEIVLLVHGALDNHAYWTDIYPRFLQKHTPIAIDLPGRARSDGPAINSAGGYVRFFNALVEALSLPSFVFCGHSMGGSMAIDFAYRHSAKVKALVLVSSAPDWEIQQEELEVWDEDPGKAYASNVEALVAKATPTELRQSYDAQLRSTPPLTCKADFEACRSFRLRDKLPAVDCSALVVCGDEEYWLDGSRALAAGLPGARLEMVPAAGHAIAVEQPDALYAAIDAYLNELG